MSTVNTKSRPPTEGGLSSAFRQKISPLGGHVAPLLMLAGIAAWANSSHSALEDPFEGPRVDPFSIMVNAKNLPSWQSFNFEDERCLATPIQSMERCHTFHASGD
jgi:hypothetical protein